MFAVKAKLYRHCNKRSTFLWRKVELKNVTVGSQGEDFKPNVQHGSGTIILWDCSAVTGTQPRRWNKKEKG